MKVIERSIVYGEEGMYAGWPANHGGWQWGNEILVGFMRGKYGTGRFHKIKEPYQKVQARSKDSGLTWEIEVPSVDFDCRNVSPSIPFNLKRSIIRSCGYYDTGGEECCEEGGYYLSEDRGRTWTGAYAFTGVSQESDLRGTSRTCVLDNLVFTSSSRKDSWGTDITYCLKHDGKRFRRIGVVCNTGGRAVMPAVVKVGKYILCAIRRRSNFITWIDAFRSANGGRSWELVSKVDTVPGHNGNPPAVASVGKTIYCAYGQRSECAIWVRASNDIGMTWSDPFVVAQGECHDVGYPRLFSVNGGRLVCVYYWSGRGEPQHIAVATILL